MYVRMSGSSLGQLLSRATKRNVETWIAMWRSGEICHLPPKYCGSKSGQKAAMGWSKCECNTLRNCKFTPRVARKLLPH